MSPPSRPTTGSRRKPGSANPWRRALLAQTLPCAPGRLRIRGSGPAGAPTRPRCNADPPPHPGHRQPAAIPPRRRRPAPVSDGRNPVKLKKPRGAHPRACQPTRAQQAKAGRSMHTSTDAQQPAEPMRPAIPCRCQARQPGTARQATPVQITKKTRGCGE